MFTNEEEQKKFSRDTSFMHMLKRYSALVLSLGILAGGYNLFSNKDALTNNIMDVAAPARAGIGQAVAADTTVEQGTALAQGVAQNIIQTLAAPNKANVSDIAATTIIDDGFDHSFYDLTFNRVQDMQGNNIGAITDVLVSPLTGRGEYLIFKSGDMRYSTPTSNIAVVNNSGDIQIANTNLVSSFVYKPETYRGFYSLKNMRTASVVDAYGTPVGKVNTLIYQQSQLQDIYILLDDEFASGANRMFKFNFDELNITYKSGEYAVMMTGDQTTNIAEYLYARN